VRTRLPAVDDKAKAKNIYDYHAFIPRFWASLMQKHIEGTATSNNSNSNSNQKTKQGRQGILHMQVILLTTCLPRGPWQLSQLKVARES